jgi:hypothetical protein
MEFLYESVYLNVNRVKHPQGVEIDDYGFTIVDLRNVGRKDESWVLATTAIQRYLIAM